LYFLLADVIHRFHYLKIGLSVVLVFVGLKMLAADVYKVPIGLSLAVIALVLGAAIIASWLWPRTPTATEPHQPLPTSYVADTKSSE
jgi:tellurite resistance protein TerC